MHAFNELVERYQGAVYNVCVRMLGDAQPAEDCTQETFFAAYRSIKSFRGGAFRSWLLRIASNQCYDLLRRRQRHPADALPDEPFVVDPSPSPDEAALSAETAAALERAIGQLPPDQRLCVLLVDVQGFDYDEAAQAMDVNLGTVKSRLSRARARLRELLGPEFRPKDGG
jgi:RNA polymerase sigma factor (sigma-70 family)